MKTIQRPRARRHRLELIQLVMVALGACGDGSDGSGGDARASNADASSDAAHDGGGSGGDARDGGGSGGAGRGGGGTGNDGGAGNDGGDAAAGSGAMAVDEEFVGPFPSWKSVKDYGASGDGTTDDTGAIQAALDDFKAVMTNAYSVLYFPAGTYRLTATLVTARAAHNDYLGVSIVGEDPETTRLSWEGPAGEPMLSLDAWYGKVSRLTFDGKGTASVGLYRGDTFSTGHELSDLRFRDMAVGVQLGGGGAGQAEHAILRCRFERITDYGITTHNFNSLDIWIWYSRFEDCGVGVYNDSGNFHVVKSLFLRSKVADIASTNLMEFSFVGNTSVGGKTFTNWESGHTWGAQVLVLGNRIYDTQDDFALVTGSAGPWLVVDNVIRNRPGYTGPSVRAAAGDQVFVGNTYTGADIEVQTGGSRNPRVRSIDPRIVARDAIPPPDMTLPPTPPNMNRKIFEVPQNTGDDAAALQAQIDLAAMEAAGSRPVVHLAKGGYRLARTVTLPADTAFQIIGDGGGDNGTQLARGDSAPGPLLHLLGPSRAILRDLQVVAGDADGILVSNADQVGGRVYAEQIATTGSGTLETAPAYGIHVNGVERSDVTLVGAVFTGAVRNIVARGGPARAAGEPAPGQVSMFNGASASGGLLYDVDDGGQLLASSLWYEGAWPEPTHFDLDSSGDLCVTGMHLAVARDAAAPVIRVSGHRGMFSFLTSNIMGLGGPGSTLRVAIDGDGTQSKVLVMGNTFWVEGDGASSAPALSEVWQDTSSPAAEASLASSNLNGNFTNGFAALPDVTSKQADAQPSDALVLEGLRLLREARIEPPNVRPAGVTDVKLFRVFASALSGKTVLEIRR